jgi:hypothetical protein
MLNHGHALIPRKPAVRSGLTLAMLSGIGGPPSTLTTACATPMLDKTNGLETNDEPQPQSVANKVPPKPVQHHRLDQWLIARGEPLKERGGKAFRASAILAFRNGPSPRASIPSGIPHLPERNGRSLAGVIPPPSFKIGFLP